MHVLIQKLCNLMVKADGRAEVAERGRQIRRATAIAYDCLLFWDGGEFYKKGTGDEVGCGDQLLGVSAGLYSMRRRGLDEQATRLEELLVQLSSSYRAHDGKAIALGGPASLTFLPTGTRQRVLKLENVDAVLSVLMLLHDTGPGVSGLQQDAEPPSPALPVRRPGEARLVPHDSESGGYTLFKDASFSMAASGHQLVATAASLPGVDPADELLLSQRPIGPEDCMQTGGGWLFGAVSHGLPPTSQAQGGDSGLAALLSLPLLHERDADGLDLISRATTARASPAHQPAALLGERGSRGMGVGGGNASLHTGDSDVVQFTKITAAVDKQNLANKEKLKGRRNLWKELFESAVDAQDGGEHGAPASCMHDANVGWRGGKLGSDWWEQLADGDGGGDTVLKSVSEDGVEEFERFSGWVEDGAREQQYPQSALVAQDDLVRDILFLSLGLSSQFFKLESRFGGGETTVGRECAEEVAEAGAVFGLRSGVRWVGVGVSPLQVKGRVKLNMMNRENVY